MSTSTSLRSAFGPPLVVWDVDRTLTTSDTLIPFLRQVVGPARWPLMVSQILARTAAHGASRSYLKMCLLRQCLAGRDHQNVLALAHDYAQVVYEQKCRPDALARWAWHRERGDTLVLASASPMLYLEPLGTLLRAKHVLATELQARGGVLTGDMDGVNCRSQEKARQINELVFAARPRSLWFYSDSRSDDPSFDLADVPIRVRSWETIPDLRDTTLFSRAADLPGGTP